MRSRCWSCSWCWSCSASCCCDTYVTRAMLLAPNWAHGTQPQFRRCASAPRYDRMVRESTPRTPRGAHGNRQLYSIGAILLSTAFLLLGNGLIGTLTPVRAHLEGFSNMAIGAMGSFYYLGFVVGCFVGPRLLARVGHIRTFAVGAALTAATVLLQPDLHPARHVVRRPCAALRLPWRPASIHGGDRKLAQRPRHQMETRGRILSAYVGSSTSTCLTLGQWLLLAAPPMGYQLFSLAAVLYIFCVVPMGLTHLRPARRPNPRPVLRVGRMMRMALRRRWRRIITVGSPTPRSGPWLPSMRSRSASRPSAWRAVHERVHRGRRADPVSAARRFSDRLDRRWIIVVNLRLRLRSAARRSHWLGRVERGSSLYLHLSALAVFRRGHVTALFAVDRARQ